MNPFGPEFVQLVLGRRKKAPTPATILGSLYHSHFYAADPFISLSVGKVTSLPNKGLDGAPAVQGTAGSRPAYSATSFGGGPGVTFNGTTNELLATFTAAIASAARPYVWCVLKPIAGTSGYYVSLVDTKPLTSKWLGGNWYSNPPLTWYLDCHVADGNQNPGATTGAFGSVMLAQFGVPNPATAVVVANGVAANGTKTGPVGAALTKMQMGLIDTAVAPANYVLAEVIVASDQPSAQQIADIVTYLKAPARNNGLGYGLP